MSLIANIIIVAVTLVLSYLDDHRACVRRARRLGIAEPRLFDHQAHKAMRRRGWQVAKRDRWFWVTVPIAGGMGVAGFELGYYGVAFALCTVLGRLGGTLRGKTYQRSRQRPERTDP